MQASIEAAPAADVVLDTQVVLDWMVFHDPAVAPVTAAVREGRVTWIATPAMRAELAHMLGHASLARWEPRAGASLALFDRFARIVPAAGPAGPRLCCRDPDDQMFVDTAIAHAARWLVTRDRELLRLARRAATSGLRIVPPARWP